MNEPKRVGFLYNDKYLGYQFGPEHPFRPIREKMTLDLLQELGVFNGVAEVVSPPMATREDLLLVHSKSYVELVERLSKRGYGLLDLGDTPATRGIFEASRQVVGGSLCGANRIMKGRLMHAFNPGGGLHHASSDSASGFCVFNDIVITIRHLQKSFGLERIAIVDIDGHHGDGTQFLLYHEPILKISFHRYGIFPGSGSVEEIGKGPGRGYSVNIPLPAGCGDDTFMQAFKEVVPPLLKKYQPQLLISQFGVDGHYQDPLVDLRLTTFTYEDTATIMHELAHSICKGRFLVLGGGGYQPRNVSRCWAVMFLTLLNRRPSEDPGLSGLHDPEPTSSSRLVKESVEKTVDTVTAKIFPMHGLS